MVFLTNFQFDHWGHLFWDRVIYIYICLLAFQITATTRDKEQQVTTTPQIKTVQQKGQNKYTILISKTLRCVPGEKQSKRYFSKKKNQKIST